LLDTPCASSLPGLINNIWKLGFDLRDLKFIVISHAHTDHYGAVRALVHMTGAKTFLGEIDAAEMRNCAGRMEKMNREMGYYNELFDADILLKDGDHIQLGNTDIQCVWTPGHTLGVMSHFWTLCHEGKELRVGIYGGAGFVTVSKKALEENGWPLSLQDDFIRSIEKVWDEKVDIMLGNHPFHNDTYQKHDRMLTNKENPFIDAEEWHRFLTELKDKYNDFLKKTPEQVGAMYAHSQMLNYYGDKHSIPKIV